MAKISQELNDLLNKQISHELRNSQIYRQIGSLFEDVKLTHLAKYFFEASKQEFDHSYMFSDYINSRNYARCICQEIPMIPQIYSINEVGGLFVKTEEETTASIEAIYEQAKVDKDGLAIKFLEEMLSEQVEEEDSAMLLKLQFDQVTDLVLFDKGFAR